MTKNRISAFVGSVPASYVADYFSRRTAREFSISVNSFVLLWLGDMIVSVAGVTFILGGALQTATPNREMMMAGRFFAGLGIGQLVSQIPTSGFRT